MKHHYVPFLGVISSAILIGCGHNPMGREAIEGTVTFKGAPLDQGSIEFRPIEKRGGLSSGARITEGAYSIPTDQGLPPGKYCVRIFSAADDPSPAPSGPPGSSPRGGLRPTIERIPAHYNEQSHIIVEVTDGGENRFDYDIK